jgi:hypothetical protein
MFSFLVIVIVSTLPLLPLTPAEPSASQFPAPSFPPSLSLLPSAFAPLLSVCFRFGLRDADWSKHTRKLPRMEGGVQEKKFRVRRRSCVLPYNPLSARQLINKSWFKINRQARRAGAAIWP